MSGRPDFPLVLDNSIVTAFRACPRSAFLTYLEHWKPKTPSVHLHAGAAFARGLEVARRAHWEHGASPEDSYAVGLRALLEAYGDFQCPSDSPKSLERMAMAYEYYWSVYPFESDTAVPILLPSGRRAVEFSFVEPLEIRHPELNSPILYSGRCDMIVTLGAGIFLEDDKTTGQLGASWGGKWDLRSQFTGYTWAARRHGLAVDGILVRGIAIYKTKFDHAQAITYRAPWEIDRWHEQLHHDVDRMVRAWQSDYWDYNLADSCDSYGGCQYSQVCKSPTPEEWLELYFTRRVWDPVERTEHDLPTGVEV